MDHMAAAPVRAEVIEAMERLLRDGHGNPHSVHGRGQKAAEALGEARERVAALVGADPYNVIFTATGSEANNLAIKGITKARKKKSNRLIISAIEHHSIIQPAKTLEKEGFELVMLPVDGTGLVDPAILERELEQGAALVSIIHASTEIGTIEPIEELAAICRQAGAPMHTDSWGAAGSIPVDIGKLGVNAMTIAGQRFGGPPGAAALVVLQGAPMRAETQGGVQERNLRAGQENLPAIAGMGLAAELAKTELEARSAALVPVRDTLLEKLPAAIDNVIVTGHLQRRLPDVASFCVEFIEGEALLLFLDNAGVMAASGSACTSKALKASHVLEALGYDAATAQGSIVFTLGMQNTIDDAEGVISAMKPIVSRLREMSPLYQKRKENGSLQ
jgi:cysteine desulfurase